MRHVHIFSSTFPDNHSTPSTGLLLLLFLRFCSCLLLLFAVTSHHYPTLQLFSLTLFLSPSFFFINLNSTAFHSSKHSTFSVAVASSVVVVVSSVVVVLLLFHYLCRCFRLLLLSLSLWCNGNPKHGTTQ